MSGKAVGIIAFVGGIVIFDILSFVFGWGGILY